MNKAILMSIQPKWLAKILNGDKSAELRKRFPKDYRGWIYLYCTKAKPYLIKFFGRHFITYSLDAEIKDDGLVKNGLVVARVWVDDVDVGKKLCDGSGYVYLPQTSLWLTNEEIMQYANNSSTLAVIYFSKLEIFDKPKELSEFYKSRFEPNKITDAYEKTFNDLSKYRVTKAPQSWQYVYVKGE